MSPTDLMVTTTKKTQNTWGIDSLGMVSWTKWSLTLPKKAHTSGEGWTYSRTGASVLKVTYRNNINDKSTKSLSSPKQATVCPLPGYPVNFRYPFPLHSHCLSLIHVCNALSTTKLDVNNGWRWQNSTDIHTHHYNVFLFLIRKRDKML